MLRGTDGSASLADRIIDVRTGLKCNYRSLYEESTDLVETIGMNWRPAFEAVAEKANDERRESVVKGLYRQHKKAQQERHTQDRPMPGLGVLYDQVAHKISELRQAIGRRVYSNNQLSAAADFADRIRRLLEDLLAEQESREPEAAVEALENLLHGLTGAFDATGLIDRERERLRELIGTCRSLQIAIDASRNDPTYRDF